MADRTHFYYDLDPKGMQCQEYDERTDILHFCKYFEPDIPKDYVGDQDSITYVTGFCNFIGKEFCIGGIKNEEVQQL